MEQFVQLLVGDVRLREKMRKKLQFPWEIPEFKSDQEIREFWDLHDVTDELLKFSTNEESYELSFEDFIVTFVIENIPIVRRWSTDGALLAEYYEDHVQRKLDKYKDYLKLFVEGNGKKLKSDRKFRVDFISGGLIKS